jgi:lysophospholipase L1-like esterase
MLALFLGFSLSAIKIMPFGDSISGGENGWSCWRAKLWQRLQQAGYTNIDFVGSIREASCSGSYDPDTEGHSGIQITDIANENQLPPWLNAGQPDIILMHLGTNDIVFGISQYGQSLQSIQDAYDKCLSQMRAYKANIILIVAKIIPMNLDFCSSCGQNVVALNNFIGQWGPSKSTPQSPITVVDQYTGFDAKVDTQEGIHPNDGGHEKMAAIWFDPLVTAIKSLS